MSNRIVFFGVIMLLLVGSSCKTKQGTDLSVKYMSAKKIIKEHNKAVFSEQTIQAKVKTRYIDSKTTQSLTIKLRIKKDEVIWMSGSFLGFPVAKVKITPTSVQYYEKLNQTYFNGDFSLISAALGADLDFKQIQSILLGEAVFADTKYVNNTDATSHLVQPKHQAESFAIFYWVNPKHYKLDKQEIKSTDSNQQLSVNYPNYQEVSKVLFPKEILINAMQNTDKTQIEMEFRNVVFNKKLTFPFSIPSGYKEIKLSDL